MTKCLKCGAIGGHLGLCPDNRPEVIVMGRGTLDTLKGEYERGRVDGYAAGVAAERARLIPISAACVFVVDIFYTAS